MIKKCIRMTYSGSKYRAVRRRSDERRRVFVPMFSRYKRELRIKIKTVEEVKKEFGTQGVMQ